jgi:hypothetical protein
MNVVDESAHQVMVGSSGFFLANFCTLVAKNQVKNQLNF